jgi:hypothetical protein
VQAKAEAGVARGFVQLCRQRANPFSRATKAISNVTTSASPMYRQTRSRTESSVFRKNTTSIHASRWQPLLRKVIFGSRRQATKGRWVSFN